MTMTLVKPGTVLKRRIKSKGINQQDFAFEIGIAPTQLNEVIKGKRRISAELAILFGEIIENADYWIKLQQVYDLEKANLDKEITDKKKLINDWQEIKKYIPTTFYRKQGVFTKDLEKDLKKAFEIYNVDSEDKLKQLVEDNPLLPAFRKSESLKTDSINLLGWLKLCQHKTAKIEEIGIFEMSSQEKLIYELKDIFVKNIDTKKRTEETLKRSGIKFLIQTKPAKVAVDGVAYWQGKHPCIVLTLRYKRLDNFAFNVFHELGHVFNHDDYLKIQGKIIIESHDEKSSVFQQENMREFEANEFAKNNLIPKEEWDEFVNTTTYFNDNDIINFASKINQNPAIVMGRVKFEKQLYRKKFNIDNTLN